MNKTNLLVVVVLFLILLQLLTVVIDASTCPPGTYYQEILHRPSCHECFYAEYCPGDGNNYPCPRGTVTPEEGMVACVKCPTIRTNSDQTVCLLADTPKDAREPDINDDENEIYTLDRKTPHWYTTIPVYGLPVGKPMELEYAFVPEQSKYDVPLTMFASLTTGQPNKNNFTWSFEGNNATIIIPYTRPDENTNFFIIYFNVAPTTVQQNSVKFIGRTFKGFQAKFSFVPNTKNSKVIDNIVNEENQVVLEWNNVPSVGRFNVSITLKDLSHEDDSYKSYSVCYSKQPSITYPNSFNSNLVVADNVNKQINIILQNAVGGVVRIGVVFGQLNIVQIDSELRILSNK
ncbi:predicted protein [Naegleria gruberi]|uniref:Predicted protein n=1 Tax=Naegleria gruberi TaxID=5762 RepID=D2V3M2_NAEGR|nr:uncharacterized protein NAEGRDRAFT_46421 [Naegleria gruberi]EFC48796.1 predicted protein [Naegleria gruberi]|eukprot:XP_002681540.1 predicted protein [Naegleria gruberi strain NEG-M]